MLHVERAEDGVAVDKRPSTTFLGQFTRVFPSRRTPWLARGRMTPDIERHIYWDQLLASLRFCTETTRKVKYNL